MSIRILIADDHAAFVERTRNFLDHEPGMKVVAAAVNGQEAVQLAQELEPDVVLMDISMPKMNGIEATKRIDKKMPHTKVLCLTVHSEKQFVSAMFRAGVVGYVLKDGPFEELSKAISLAHEGKRYVSPQIAQYVNDVNRSL